MIGQISQGLNCSLSLKIIRDIPKVLILGGKGRLGDKISEYLRNSSVDVLVSSRSPSNEKNRIITLSLQETPEQIKKVLVDNKISAVINAAAQSSGNFEEMAPVNINTATNFANACESLQMPMIHLSSMATEIIKPDARKSCSPSRFPYALSKLYAEQALEGFRFTSIVRIDALLGDESSSKIDLSLLVGAGKYTGLCIQIEGLGAAVQPTSYEAAAKAISNHVLNRLNNIPCYKDVNIVGQGISLNQLARSFSNTPLEVHIPVHSLERLANEVNEGALTKEFINLAKLSDNNTQTFCSGNFEKLHGDKIPTPSCLTETVKKTTSGRSYYNTAKRIITQQSLLNFFLLTGDVLKSAKLKVNTQYLP